MQDRTWENVVRRPGIRRIASSQLASPGVPIGDNRVSMQYTVRNAAASVFSRPALHARRLAPGQRGPASQVAIELPTGHAWGLRLQREAHRVISKALGSAHGCASASTMADSRVSSAHKCQPPMCLRLASGVPVRLNPEDASAGRSRRFSALPGDVRRPPSEIRAWAQGESAVCPLS